MLAWNGSDPEDECHAGGQRDGRQHHQQIARRGNCLGALHFDVQRVPQQAERLPLIEGPLPPLDGGDERVAILPRVADAAEHTQLQRGVHDSRGHEHENNSWSNQQELTVEAHSGN